MERYFGNAYRGDPGVPHADPDRFVNIWVGSAFFAVTTWFNPYIWQLSTQWKKLALASRLLLSVWHDRAFLFEQYHWKKALKQNKKYKFKWNEYMDRDLRDSYYFNWPVYFR